MPVTVCTMQQSATLPCIETSADPIVSNAKRLLMVPYGRLD